MAEGGGQHRTGSFAKTFQKRVFRTKEKVLQNLGKSEKTQDAAFDKHVENFNTQCATATKYQKELRNYINCAKAMQSASKNFYNVVEEMYEENWVGHSKIVSIIETLDLLWSDYTTKLIESVQDPLIIYLNDFPVVKTKVSKRGRKLVDYDSARHALSSLQGAKKQDDAKIAKATQELHETKTVYEDLNNELHHSLPDLYDKRIGITSGSFYSLFEAERTFQTESAQLKAKLSETVEDLQRENSRGTYTPGRLNGDNTYVESPATRALPAQGISLSFNNDLSDSAHPDKGSDSEDSLPRKRTSEASQRTSTPSHDPEPAIRVSVAAASRKHESESDRKSTASDSQPAARERPYTGTPMAHNGQVNGQKDAEDSVYEEVETESPAASSPESASATVEPVPKERSHPHEAASETTQPTAASQEPTKRSPSEGSAPGSPVEPPDSGVYQVPTSNEPVKLPAGVHYQAVATHPYSGDDFDELTFEPGDVINVIPPDEPDEQDDGWQTGILVKNGEKGVFPENFTKKL